MPLDDASVGVNEAERRSCALMRIFAAPERAHFLAERMWGAGDRLLASGSWRNGNASDGMKLIEGRDSIEIYCFDFVIVRTSIKAQSSE